MPGMPLDAQVQQLLSRLEALAGPYEEMTPAEARATYSAVVEARRGPDAEPPPVGAVADRVASTDAGAVPVRVYSPPAPDTAPPLVLFFHGGGWVIGDLDTHDVQARTLCATAQAVVVSVDYRRAPEDPFPAALEDCHAATGWAVGAAGELGADGSRVAVAGDSAGGNLAAAVCLLARAAGGPVIAAQALVYPVVDALLSSASVDEFMSGYGLDASTMRWFVEQYLPDPGRRREPLASPLHAPDLSGLPPAIVATAEFDLLRDEGEAYARALHAAGVPVRLLRYEGLVHGFLGMGSAVGAAGRAVTEIWTELRRLLDEPVTADV